MINYYFTDHLGNIRLWYSDLNGDGEIKVQSDGTITHCNDEQTSNGEILQEQHYYPYGLTMGGLNYTSDVLTSLSYGRDQHLYTAKELTEQDLNLYNFGTRWYDMSLGRWMVHDPKYQFSSPYLAMGNDPVSNVDPTGMEAYPGFTLPGMGGTGGDGRSGYYYGTGGSLHPAGYGGWNAGFADGLSAYGMKMFAGEYSGGNQSIDILSMLPWNVFLAAVSNGKTEIYNASSFESNIAEISQQSFLQEPWDLPLGIQGSQKGIHHF